MAHLQTRSSLLKELPESACICCLLSGHLLGDSRIYAIVLAAVQRYPLILLNLDNVGQGENCDSLWSNAVATIALQSGASKRSKRNALKQLITYLDTHHPSSPSSPRRHIATPTANGGGTAPAQFGSPFREQQSSSLFPAASELGAGRGGAARGQRGRSQSERPPLPLDAAADSAVAGSVASLLTAAMPAARQYGHLPRDAPTADAMLAMAAASSGGGGGGGGSASAAAAQPSPLFTPAPGDGCEQEEALVVVHEGSGATLSTKVALVCAPVRGITAVAKRIKAELRQRRFHARVLSMCGSAGEDPNRSCRCVRRTLWAEIVVLLLSPEMCGGYLPGYGEQAGRGERGTSSGSGGGGSDELCVRLPHEKAACVGACARRVQRHMHAQQCALIAMAATPEATLAQLPPLVSCYQSLGFSPIWALPWDFRQGMARLMLQLYDVRLLRAPQFLFTISDDVAEVAEALQQAAAARSAQVAREAEGESSSSGSSSEYESSEEEEEEEEEEGQGGQAGSGAEQERNPQDVSSGSSSSGSSGERRRKEGAIRMAAAAAAHKHRQSVALATQASKRAAAAATAAAAAVTGKKAGRRGGSSPARTGKRKRMVRGLSVLVAPAGEDYGSIRKIERRRRAHANAAAAAASDGSGTGSGSSGGQRAQGKKGKGRVRDGRSLPALLRRLRTAVARNTHEVWLASRARQGWRWSAEKERVSRGHPRMVPWAALPKQERAFNLALAEDLLLGLLGLGYEVRGDTSQRRRASNGTAAPNLSGSGNSAEAAATIVSRPSSLSISRKPSSLLSVRIPASAEVRRGEVDALKSGIHGSSGSESGTGSGDGTVDLQLSMSSSQQSQPGNEITSSITSSSSRSHRHSVITLQHPGGQFKPHPFPTDAVVLPPSMLPALDLLAETCHNSWARVKMEQGWLFGRQWSEEEKTHPHLLPFALLQEKDKEVNRQTATQAVKMICGLGYSVTASTRPAAPRGSSSGAPQAGTRPLAAGGVAAVASTTAEFSSPSGFSLTPRAPNHSGALPRSALSRALRASAATEAPAYDQSFKAELHFRSMMLENEYKRIMGEYELDVSRLAGAVEVERQRQQQRTMDKVEQRRRRRQSAMPQPQPQPPHDGPATTVVGSTPSDGTTVAPSPLPAPAVASPPPVMQLALRNGSGKLVTAETATPAGGGGGGGGGGNVGGGAPPPSPALPLRTPRSEVRHVLFTYETETRQRQLAMDTERRRQHAAAQRKLMERRQQRLSRRSASARPAATAAHRRPASAAAAAQPQSQPPTVVPSPATVEAAATPSHATGAEVGSAAAALRLSPARLPSLRPGQPSDAPHTAPAACSSGGGADSGQPPTTIFSGESPRLSLTITLQQQQHSSGGGVGGGGESHPPRGAAAVVGNVITDGGAYLAATPDRGRSRGGASPDMGSLLPPAMQQQHMTSLLLAGGGGGGGSGGTGGAHIYTATPAATTSIIGAPALPLPATPVGGGGGQQRLRPVSRGGIAGYDAHTMPVLSCEMAAAMAELLPLHGAPPPSMPGSIASPPSAHAASSSVAAPGSNSRSSSSNY